MSRSCLTAVLFTAATVFAGTANAGTINFTDNPNWSYPATFTETVGGTGEGAGASAVFGNVIKEAGSGLYFGGGLGLGSGGIGHSWTVVFDQALTWTATTLSFSSGSANLGFNVSGAGINAQNLLQGVAKGSYALVTPLLFQANELYTFTSNNQCSVTNCGAVLFADWTFGPLEVTSATVPEPGSLALLGLGFAGLGFARRSRASKR